MTGRGGLDGGPQIGFSSGVTRIPRPRLGAFLLAMALGLSACARGADVSGRGGDAGRREGGARDGGSAPLDAEPGVCDPLCADGERCVDGVCAVASDADGDGLDQRFDCDDGDVLVGASAERSCRSACGEGLERCTDGVWDACDAPTTCECEASTPPRSIECGSCGTQRQVCSGGAWADDGACVEAGVCTPGATESETRACGNCGMGSQSRSRTCEAARCDWGAWGAWSACVGGGACEAGSTRACPNGDSCGVQVCSSACVWPSACSPNAGSECLRIRPGTSGPAGNNYRCCSRSGSDPTGWQFCLPPDGAGHCFWSTACDATTSC